MPDSSTQPAPSGPHRLRARAASGVTWLGGWVEANPHVTLVVFLCVLVLADLGNSLATPLGHDELFTFYISQAQTWKDLLVQTRRIDLNPPLSYALTRLSLCLFGEGTLQCRLPEIAGFALACASLFGFVRRRAGAAAGLLAAALLFASRAGDLNILARPYGLMLGFATLALLCWQGSLLATTRRGALVQNLLLATALAALLLSHVFGLIAWGALVCGELTQAFERRRLDRSRTLALLLPLLACATYKPLLASHGLSVFPAAFQPTGEDIFNFYIQHIDRELIVLGPTAFVVVVVAGKKWLRGSQRFFLSRPEWVVVAVFLAAPLALILRLMLAHEAYFDRYGVIACIGVAILFTALLMYWVNNRAGVCVIAAFLALTISSRTVTAVSASVEAQIFRHTDPVLAPSHLDMLTDPALPLVDASGLTFVEMQRREPAALLARTYYLTGGDAAIRYAHATIFEGMAWEADHFKFASSVESYPEFIAEHPHFYVLGTFDYPEDWLLRKLLADQARIVRVGTVDALYKDHELYEVTMPAQVR
jgi:hypothetical protein